MVRERLCGLNAYGVTMAELLVVVAIVGVVSAASTPYFMSYMQSASLKAAAQELATMVSGGRQLAIARNTTVCVALSGNQALYKTGVSSTCRGGTTYLGANTRSELPPVRLSFPCTAEVPVVQLVSIGDWPLPQPVKALTTAREGEACIADFDGWSLLRHVHPGTERQMLHLTQHRLHRRSAGDHDLPIARHILRDPQPDGLTGGIER